MKSVLIVDNDPLSTKVLFHLLSDVGYYVISADSFKTALNILTKQIFDLVISEQTIQEGNGLEFCSHITLEYNIRFIFLTHSTTVSDIVLGFQNGAIDYIFKPYEYAELLIRI